MSYVGKGGAIIDDGFVCLPIRRIFEIPLGGRSLIASRFKRGEGHRIFDSPNKRIFCDSE